MAKRPSTPVSSKQRSGPELFAAELRDRYINHPDVTYSIDRFIYGAQNWLGIRASFVEPHTSTIASGMNYHSGAQTRELLAETLALLDD